MDFTPYLSWVDVPDPAFPPAGARMISAGDLLRYENALNAAKNELALLNGQGQRGYKISEVAGRTITVWDYLNNREQLIYGDTGDRDLSSMLPAGATAVRCGLRRTGNVCTLTMYDVKMLANGSGNFFVIPSGFRPTMQVSNTAQGLSSRIQATQAGNVQGYNWTAATSIYGSLVWQTSDPWPTTLPGTPA